MRFCRNGLLRAEVAPPATTRLAPSPAMKPVIEIADSTPSPPALSADDSMFDSAGECKSKLRRQIGSNTFSSNAAIQQDQEHEALH